MYHSIYLFYKKKQVKPAQSRCLFALSGKLTFYLFIVPLYFLLLLSSKLIRTLRFVLPSVRFETHFQKNQLNQMVLSDRRALNVNFSFGFSDFFI